MKYTGSISIFIQFSYILVLKINHEWGKADSQKQTEKNTLNANLVNQHLRHEDLGVKKNK